MEYLFLVRWGVNPGEDVMSAVEYGPLSPSQYKARLHSGEMLLLTCSRILDLSVQPFL
eukprot:m.106826 g.106826  ORF g.106826 m.106826 type:complete len:58 (+) comp37269_c0_seq42:1622-1795(+)